VADPRSRLFNEPLLLRVEVFPLFERSRIEESGLKQSAARANGERELSFSRERSRDPLTTCGGNLNGALFDVLPHDGCDRFTEALVGLVCHRSNVASPAP
jgi:hypothetical protein